jgi:hypothetical protein
MGTVPSIDVKDERRCSLATISMSDSGDYRLKLTPAHVLYCLRIFGIFLTPTCRVLGGGGTEIEWGTSIY